MTPDHMSAGGAFLWAEGTRTFEIGLPLLGARSRARPTRLRRGVSLPLEPAAIPLRKPWRSLMAIDRLWVHDPPAPRPGSKGC